MQQVKHFRVIVAFAIALLFGAVGLAATPATAYAGTGYHTLTITLTLDDEPWTGASVYFVDYWSGQKYIDAPETDTPGTYAVRFYHGGNLPLQAYANDGIYCGWKTTVEYNNNGDVEQDAHAWCKLYTVTYDPNGQELVSPVPQKIIYESDLLYAPTAPTAVNPDYEFLGWGTTPEWNATLFKFAKSAQDSVYVKQPTTLYAKWGGTIPESAVSLSKTSFSYTGKEIKPAVTVAGYKADDYTVTYENNIAVGEATVTVQGIHNFTGTVTKTFSIVPKDLKASSQVTLDKTVYAYSGYAKKPAVTVKCGTKVLTAGTDYTVKYANNTAIGTAKVTVTGKGLYAGTVTKTFKINPAKTAIKSLAKGTKSFTVTWTPKTKAAAATGYQIRYSTKSTMASPKTVTVTSYKTKTKTVKSLKANKKYYVQMRTYKTVNGVKKYSDWSAKKYVTTK